MNVIMIFVCTYHIINSYIYIKIKYYENEPQMKQWETERWISTMRIGKTECCDSVPESHNQGDELRI